MADQKLTALAETTTPVGDDIFYIVTDTGGTPVSEKIKYSTLALDAYGYACSDETTDLTTGLKATFRMPYAFYVVEARASLTTAATGSTFDVDISEGGVSIFSTIITIDSGEKTSTTAATPPVISDANIADDAEMTVDVDQIGSTVAGAGLKILLIGYKL